MNVQYPITLFDADPAELLSTTTRVSVCLPACLFETLRSCLRQRWLNLAFPFFGRISLLLTSIYKHELGPYSLCSGSRMTRSVQWPFVLIMNFAAERKADGFSARREHCGGRWVARWAAVPIYEKRFHQPVALCAAFSCHAFWIRIRLPRDPVT